MSNYFYGLVFLMFITGCSGCQQETADFLTEIEVEEFSLIRNNEIGAPATIKAVSDGLLLFDYGFYRVLRLDFDGNKQLEFGKEGRGPGEFLDLYGFWELDDRYLVYDYTTTKFIFYDTEGSLVKEVPITFDEFTAFPTQIEVITHDQFIIPSNGRDGSLFTFVDLEAQSSEYFGKAVGAYVEYLDFEEAHRAIAAGRVPAHKLNSVMLSSNSTGIFSFQQATAVLEKYAPSGELLWAISLKIPAAEGLFERFFQENAEESQRGILPSFQYAKGIDGNENGVALLLNNHVLDWPVTVVWVPNEGDSITVVTFPAIENQPYQMFTISESESLIYFVSLMDGDMYRAAWPL